MALLYATQKKPPSTVKQTAASSPLGSDPFRDKTPILKVSMQRGGHNVLSAVIANGAMSYSITDGWAGYFHYGNSTRVFAKLQWYVEARVGRWLWKKHAKIRGRYAPEHSREQLRERYGLYRMPHHAAYGKS